MSGYTRKQWEPNNLISADDLNRMEEGIAEANRVAWENIPRIGSNGNWWIGENDTHVGSQGTPPYIGANGNWWFGETDTGVKAAGYTPVKGVDYFTPADKAEIINAVIDSFGGSPVHGYVDANNNIFISGNLANKNYTVKYEMEDGSTVDIGDLTLETEEVEEPTNFFIIGGDGYLNPGRASSSGADRTDVSSCLLSNYIEIQNGDEIYVEGMVLDGAACSLSALYKEGKTGGVGFEIDQSPTQLKDISLLGDVKQFTINWAEAAFIRICGVIPSDLNAVKVTIKRNGEWL